MMPFFMSQNSVCLLIDKFFTRINVIFLSRKNNVNS